MTVPGAPPHDLQTRRVEFTEAAAYADLLGAAPAEWRCVAERQPQGWLLLAPPLQGLLFNRVLGVGLDAPATRPWLAAMVDRFRGAGVRDFGIPLSPAAAPEDLPRWLADLGLAPRDHWAKVHRPAGAIAPAVTDLRIARVGAEHAGGFAAIVAQSFGMADGLRPWIASVVGRDRWRHYLAWDGEQAVAAAGLFVHDDVGWLGMAGTLPSHRRRRAQAALMARRLEDGMALGCRWFVTETSQDLPERPNPSFHNMLRAGFQVAYLRPNFMPAGG